MQSVYALIEDAASLKICYIIIIINNSICLRHISSNKTIQRHVTHYLNIQISLK